MPFHHSQPRPRAGRGSDAPKHAATHKKSNAPFGMEVEWNVVGTAALRPYRSSPERSAKPESGRAAIPAFELWSSPQLAQG
jgi:hypothetical protein